MSSYLHDTDYQIQFKQGVAANINTTATRNSAVEGEPHWTTNTNALFVYDGANNVRVHGLDLLVTYEDAVICFSGDAVWLAFIRTGDYKYA